MSPILLYSNLIYGFRNICLVKCHLEQDLNIRQSGEEDEKDSYRQREKPEWRPWEQHIRTEGRSHG